MASNNTDIVNEAFVKIGEAPVTDIAASDERATKANAIIETVRDRLIPRVDWAFARKRTRLKAAGLLDLSSRTVTITGNTAPTEDAIVLDSTESFVAAGFTSGDRVYVQGSPNGNDGFKGISLSTDPVALTLALDGNEDLVSEVITNSSDLKLYLSPAHSYKHKYAKPSNCLKVWSINDYGPEMPEPYWEEEGDYIATSELDTRDQIDIVYGQQITDVTKMSIEFKNAWVASMGAELCQTITSKRSLRADLLQEMEFWIDEAMSLNAIRNNKNRTKRKSNWQKSGR